MEQCPKCEAMLYVANNFITVEGDNSPDTKTEVFMNLPRVCINPDCDNHNPDLNNLTNIIETQVHKIY